MSDVRNAVNNKMRKAAQLTGILCALSLPVNVTNYQKVDKRIATQPNRRGAARCGVGCREYLSHIRKTE